ncbi:MAG: sporulation protein YqfD [Bacillota bacterium]
MRIWHSLRGYVMIKIEGLHLERFLNLCMLEKIGIWGISRKTRTVMFAKVGVRDFPRLRKVVRRTGCHVSIKRRQGALFLFTRFRFRKFLLAGAVMAVALIYLLSSYVWSIEFIGVSANDQAVYMQQLNDQGVHVGMFSNAIRLREIEDNLIVKNEDVVWACARLSGVKLSIEVVKGDEVPELTDTQTPTHVIAIKDAVVSSMTVLEGKRAVKDGETVTQGQELISGVFEYGDKPARYVHAQGEVLGRVWYSAKASLPAETINATDTGRIHTVRYLYIGGWEIPLDDEADPYKNSRKETVTYDLIGEGLFVKAQVKAVRYYEQNIEKVPADVEELKIAAKTKAWEAMKPQLPTDALIKNRDYVFSIESGRLVCEVRVETLEKIGKVVKLNTP